MLPFSLMDRQEQARPSPWRDSSTVSLTNLEESSQEPSRISSGLSRGVKMKKSLLWLGLLTSRFIMKL